MNSLKIKKIVFTFSSCFIIFTIVFMVLASFISASESIDEQQGYEDFSASWYYESGDMANLDSISEGGRIHKKIPELSQDIDFTFNARNIDVDVYIDDVCIYKTEPTKNSFLKAIYGKTAGSLFVDIPMMQEYSGKELYIDMRVPYKNTTTCKIVHMYLGNGSQIVKHNVASQLGSFCFSIIILFLGIVCLILYFPMSKSNMADESMLYLGAAALTFGMTMITDTKMLQSIVGHESLFYMISQMFMSLLIVPLLLFFDKIHEKLNNVIVITLCILNLVDFVLAFVLDCLGIIDYNDNGVVTIMICGVSILYILIVTVRDIIKKKNDNLFHNIGVVLIAVAIVLDMVVAKIGVFVETSFFTKFGIAGFTCMECTQVLWKHIEDYQKGVKAQLVSRLAYHDGLTDMLNRTSFIEDMDKLESDNHSDILIAVFDVNNLKYVNDTFGHTSGDDLIVSVANAIRDCFEEFGSCYRTGGDEFVFIAKRKHIENTFNSAQESLMKRLEKISEFTEYPVSVATGYALMSEKHATLHQLLDEADERMYENKKIMKEKMHLPESAKVEEKTEEKAEKKAEKAEKKTSK